ncbi:TIGR00645 family protein [Pseudolysinimonas sp.]|uniref:TIGR00645 family protein n=1 Tax=Pseudolysinimonas sp. TaxID=2680009 RepID=UPI003F7FB07B
MSTEPTTPTRPPRWYEQVEHGGERFLFASRWLLAPLYVGMVVAVVAVGIKFFQELWHLITHIVGFTGDQVISSILALIDLALLANLVLIVIFAGYENFVSKIAAARRSEDRPRWMGHVDFSGLKMKLIGSIVAISAIGLLADFTNLEEPGKRLDETLLMWRVILHLTFVVSGVLFAIMDWLGEKRLLITKQTHGHADESD